MDSSTCCSNRADDEPLSPRYEAMYRRGAVASAPLTVRSLSRLFEYALALDQQKDEDHVFEHQGVAVVVDKVSMQFVFGSEVDYVDGLQGAGFVVNNPNVVAACGCGSSFQVREDAAEGASAQV